MQDHLSNTLITHRGRLTTPNHIRANMPLAKYSIKGKARENTSA